VTSMQQDPWNHCYLFDIHDPSGPSETPSHGENRGSSPLGSASEIKSLAAFDFSASNNRPI
jgi:hypothetical protein